MPIRAYLVLYRMQLIWCAVLALLVPFSVVLLTASENGPDFGVFWNHFCGCAPAASDAFFLLYGSGFTALIIGVLLGLGNPSGNAYATSTASAAARNSMPYTLTRPMPRSTALFAPAAVAALLITTLPALGFAIVFGWMHLVHTPALAFFPKALRLVPDAALLPPNASLLSLFIAAHALSIYLGSISIGCSIFTLFYAQRWLLLSPRAWVRLVAVFQTTLLFVFPIMLPHIGRRFSSWMFLIPRGQNLLWHPSPVLLLFHYLVPAALLLWSWNTLKAADF